MKTSKSKYRNIRPPTSATTERDVRPKEPAHSGRLRTRSKAGAEEARHSRLRSIDGRHPLQTEVPSAVVAYPAKRRRDSEIAFFNFDLARKIGLLSSGHPDQLNPALRRALLDTFSLVIVNEWDEAHGNQPRARDRQAHSYMATRYLQLQHPDKLGLNSGDGRSIWNGVLQSRAGSFDVSSCGTGVTRLCPATSAEGRFFKTGNSISDYGCGTAHIEEGIGAALMSESFSRNGIQTERVLAVLSLPSGQAINVRVAPNLLRPSHFFGLLRRQNDEDLRSCVSYYAEREIRDGRWPAIAGQDARIRYLAERIATDFARTTALFESEYIFCWLDWDGDNVLCDGSIIDYGSVRQFGLYHHDYRFADTDRMSTSIPEQKRKARQIVQRFVQIRELLLTGKRKPLATLKNDPVLKLFDREFESHKRRLFLRQIGFDEDSNEAIRSSAPKHLEELLRLHNRLERTRSSHGRHSVADGLSSNAVYCMRDILRELPARLLNESSETTSRLRPEDFFAIALSDYASRKDKQRTPYRRRLAARYQRAYLALIQWAARRARKSPRTLLEELAPRAEQRNPYARMTGDGLTHATRRLTTNRRRLKPEETYRLIQAFADSQQREDLRHAYGKGKGVANHLERMNSERPLVQRIHRDMQKLARTYRESL
ncbi:MAG: hypothetical protein ABGX04_08165 [Myxococcales bacterium]|nr:hypothetical protein [Myxococcales bacterium]HIK86008.1 hypothetical protein [Myxococcales bacterium]